MKTKMLENKIVLVYDHGALKSITEPMMSGGYHKVEIVYDHTVQHSVLDSSHIVKHDNGRVWYETHAQALHALYECLNYMDYSRKMERDAEATEPILFYEED